MILPRFHASVDEEGPIVVDRDRTLQAGFNLATTAQAVARLLNADSAMLDTFYWSPTIKEADRG